MRTNIDFSACRMFTADVDSPCCGHRSTELQAISKGGPRKGIFFCGQCGGPFVLGRSGKYRSIAQKVARSIPKVVTNPSVGDVIYIPSRMYIDRGEDDIAGGQAIVSKVTPVQATSSLLDGDLLVDVKNVPDSFYWSNLKPNQVELRKIYGLAIAAPSPC